MAINFPNSPNLNDTFKFGSKFYKWNGTAWSPENNTSSIKPVEYTNLNEQGPGVVSIDPSVNNYFKLDVNQTMSIDLPSASPRTSFMLELNARDNLSIASPTLANTLDTSVYDTAPGGLNFTSDGTKMFFIGNTGDTVKLANLTTPFNINTISTMTSLYVGGNTTNPTSVTLDNAGTTMWLLTGGTVLKYTLTTAFVLSTAGVPTSFVLAWAGGYAPLDIQWYGGYLYALSIGRFQFPTTYYPIIRQHDPNNGNYKSTYTVTDIAIGIGSTSGKISSNGTRMFLSNASGIYQYTLSTPYDVSTATYDGISFVSTPFYAGIPNINGLYINNENSKLYIHSASYRNIKEFNLDNPLSPVITWSSNIQWSGGYAPSLSYEYKSLTTLINFITYDGINWIADIVSTDLRK